jgi:hypothetical protein
MAKAKKQRTTSRAKEVEHKMKTDKVFAQKMKDEYVKKFGEMKPGEDKLRGDSAIVAKILANAEKSGKTIKGYSGSGSGDSSRNSEEEEKKEEKKDESDDEVVTPKKGKRSPEEQEKAVKEYSDVAAEAEKAGVSLQKFLKNKKKVQEQIEETSSENVDMQLASTYLNMIAEAEQNNFVAQVIQEMENILEEGFSDEEYNVLYEYILNKLEETK